MVFYSNFLVLFGFIYPCYTYEDILSWQMSDSGLLVDIFNSFLDWKTMEAPTEGMKFLQFVNKIFLTECLWEPTRGKNILDLDLITQDDIVEDVNVSKEQEEVIMR